MPDAGCRMPDAGCQIPDTGYPDQGIVAAGPSGRSPQCQNLFSGKVGGKSEIRNLFGWMVRKFEIRNSKFEIPRDEWAAFPIPNS